MQGFFIMRLIAHTSYFYEAFIRLWLRLWQEPQAS